MWNKNQRKIINFLILIFKIIEKRHLLYFDIWQKSAFDFKTIELITVWSHHTRCQIWINL